MPQPSSQGSASSPPDRKRKQPTIASFFGKKPSSSQQSPSGAGSQPQPKPKERGDFRGDKENKDRVIKEKEDEDEDEDEEVVAPAPKRARVNGSQDSGRKASTAATEEQDPVADASQKTDLSKFTSSPAVDSAEKTQTDDPDAKRRQKEKEKLHHKFVKRLGGADCLIGIGSDATKDTTGGTEDAAEAEDDEEPAKPAPKGKATKKGGSKLTPLEKQVIDIKRKHMDTILVVEVGYKFRFFGEDARVAARELSIVCIPGKMRYDERMHFQSCSTGNVADYDPLADPSEAHIDRFASASIPVHRLHVHVKRLITAGYKVGVVRQMETAALKAAGDNRNAPFGRKLTNLYTKGTYIDDVEGMEGPAPAVSEGSPATGYLLCITETNAKGWGNDEKVHVGIVAVQPATGDVIYDDFEDGFMRSEIETRLLHIAPCELLIVGELSKATEKLVQHLSGSKLNVFGDKVRVERTEKKKTAAAESHSDVSSFYAEKMKSSNATDDAQASNLLQKVLSLPEQVTICLSAMISHMTDYGLEHVFELTKYFQHFSARSHMLLNGNTLVSLEIYQNQTDHSAKGSLFWTLDRTHTRFGQRMLRKWVGRPLLDKEKLEKRINAVEELISSERTGSVERVKGLLGKIRSDLERSLIRIYYGKVGISSTWL